MDGRDNLSTFSSDQGDLFGNTEAATDKESQCRDEQACLVDNQRGGRSVYEQTFHQPLESRGTFIPLRCQEINAFHDLLSNVIP